MFFNCTTSYILEAFYLCPDLFSDILVIPHALGQQVSFKEKKGPVLKPIKDIKDLKYFNTEKWDNILSPVYETIGLIKAKNRNKSLFGFCGSPFTVLTYMIEGGTSKDHKRIKSFLLSEPQKAKEIINLLVEISIHYLSTQIKAGADIIQLFESWSAILEDDLYNDFIIKY